MKTNNNKVPSTTKQYLFQRGVNNDQQHKQICFLSYNAGHPLNTKNIKFTLGKVRVFAFGKYFTADISSQQNLCTRFDWDQAFFLNIISRFSQFNLLEGKQEQLQYVQLQVKCILKSDQNQQKPQAISKEQQNQKTQTEHKNPEGQILQKKTIDESNAKTNQRVQESFDNFREQVLVRVRLNEDYSKKPMKQLWNCYSIFNEYKQKSIQNTEIRCQELTKQRQIKTEDIVKKSNDNDRQIALLQKQLSLLLTQKIHKLAELGEQYEFEGQIKSKKMDLQEEQPIFGTQLFSPSQDFYFQQ